MTVSASMDRVSNDDNTEEYLLFTEADALTCYIGTFENKCNTVHFVRVLTICDCSPPCWARVYGVFR
ncbi:Uncharacterised protein [Escherichia coli]|nr:Uncharacterised protein [Escherichia coli]SQM11624.1 Uncharacterised protein [Escherichia coli]SQM25971.1 Uncharacterised protein [Escherichia coli]